MTKICISVNIKLRITLTLIPRMVKVLLPKYGTTLGTLFKRGVIAMILFTPFFPALFPKSLSGMNGDSSQVRR